MADEPDNLVLERLRDIRGVLGTLAQDVSDIKSRLGRLESQNAVSLSQIQVTLAEHSVRFDRIDERLARLERRTGLVEST
jgi:hypothetical protein